MRVCVQDETTPSRRAPAQKLLYHFLFRALAQNYIIIFYFIFFTRARAGARRRLQGGGEPARRPRRESLLHRQVRGPDFSS